MRPEQTAECEGDTQEKVKEAVEDHMHQSIVAYRDDSDLRDAVNVAQRTVS